MIFSHHGARGTCSAVQMSGIMTFVTMKVQLQSPCRNLSATESQKFCDTPKSSEASRAKWSSTGHQEAACALSLSTAREVNKYSRHAADTRKKAAVPLE